jgi:hypothetical protein
MRSFPRLHRASPSDRPSSVDPRSTSGGLLGDLAGFAALTLFVIAIVWFVATAGELVALWRLGAGQ